MIRISMTRRLWLLLGLALSSALLQGVGTKAYAQSLSYSISVSPLPAQAGEPLTLSVPVPLTIPDGTSFILSAQTPCCITGPYSPPNYSYQVVAQSANYQFTVQIPAVPTAPTGTPVPQALSIVVSQGTAIPQIGATGQYLLDPTFALGPGTRLVPIYAAGQPPLPNAAFNGTYSFLFQGQLAGEPATANAIAAAGSFTAMGDGTLANCSVNITSADGNQPYGEPFSGSTIVGASCQGTYQLDATGKGTINLLPDPANAPYGLTIPVSFNFFVSPNQAGIPVTHASIVPPAGVTGSGEISPTSNFIPSASYDSSSFLVFSPLYAGTEFLSVNSGVGSVPGAGILSFLPVFNPDANTGVTSAGETALGASTSFSGSFASGGSGLVSANANSVAPARAPLDYAFYQGTGPTGVPVIYFLSVDPYAVSGIVSGIIHQ